MTSLSEGNKIQIQLGDIIEIIAPSNELINENFYLVKFIDSSKIILLGKLNQEIILNINENNEIDDESITSISIINRSEEEGYARQNKLLPKSWINIYFGGDVPLIITGEITNLENDMIEIKTYPNNDIIYIDFEYKGLPSSLPIEKIELRNQPMKISEEDDSLKEINKTFQDSQFESIEDQDLEDIAPQIQIEPKDLILDADQIQIGNELDDLIQIVEVKESELRYGIDKQMDDMLNELLSTIPNQERNANKLNEIHKIIERYKELRDEFSIFNKENNDIKPKKIEDNHKPLKNSLNNLSKKLFWILPISSNNKKIYDTDIEEGSQYVENNKLSNSLEEQFNIVETWKSNLIPDMENKYLYYLKQLNSLATPFTNSNISDFITNISTNCNLYTIINNLEDEKSYASKEEELITTRFISQVYNEGLNKLQSTVNENRKITNKIIKATNNDKVLIKGFLTLPFPAFQFSYINMSKTSILKRSNLNKNFISYWQILKNNTLVQNIYINNLSESLKYKPSNFLNNIKQYLLEETIDKSTNDLYDNYLNVIIPSSKELFNLIKTKIKNKYSLYEIIQYLEPFEINSNDLQFDDYLEIENFIKLKISEYKKDFSIKLKEINKIKRKKLDSSSAINPSLLIIFNILSSDLDIKEQVFKAYNISEEKSNLSQLELLNKMIRIDFGKLFMLAISKINLDLMVSVVLDEFLQIESQISSETLENKCKQYILSKKYFSLEDLESDNNKEIYFDKKFDNTFYNIIDEYKEESQIMDPKEFINFLIQKLKDNVGLEEKEAEREAIALVKKQRPVINGDYALLEIPDKSNQIYIRTNNVWILDSSLSKDIFFEGNKFFCESQFNCYQKDNECIDDKNVIKKIQKNNLKNILNQFDESYRINLQKIKSDIDKSYLRELENIPKKIKVEKNEILKYNNQFLFLSTLIEEREIIESPYEKLRNYILGEQDMIKKQEFIIQFVLKFTREPYENEDSYWFYCKSTNIKLLPKFLYTLAQVFVSKGNYIKTLDIICAQQGTISEDGDKWIDKHSGYEIRSIDLDTEEGYEESGYKLQTRELLEDDAGNVLLQSSQVIPSKTTEYSDPTMKTILNIIQSLSEQMFISVEDHYDFIIKNVLEIQRINLPSEKEYNLALEKALKRTDKKQLPSYEDAKNSSLLILTFVMYLLAIQISIPSINTLKTFPGCIKSFTGYPMTGKTDKSAITYIACVASKISSSVKPWNAINKLKESSLVKKMESIIEQYILSNEEINSLFKKKLLFLSLEESKIIPDELDIKQWTSFLPPLISFKLKSIVPFSKVFSSELTSSLKKGSPKQSNDINSIKTKIESYSLSIQELIQEIISVEKPILSSSNGDPFLENACCNSSNNTIKYFYEKNIKIKQYNKQVEGLEYMLEDIFNLTSAPYYFDPINTRAIYPIISSEFSEKTIYKAFIYYCKFIKSLPISEELRAICFDKPEGLDINMSIDEQINQLKLIGRIYSTENLNQLILYISKQNIIPIDLNNIIVNSYTIFKDLINQFNLQDTNIFSKTILTDLSNLIDTYDSTYKEDFEENRKIKNFLSRENDRIIDLIKTFVRKHSKLNKSKFLQFEECLTNLLNFLNEDFKIKMDKLINFSKNNLINIISIIPNIVINEVNYNDIIIPKHWDLSNKHESDIKNIVELYYNSLTKLYGDDQLKLIFEKIQYKCKDILQLVQFIYYQTNLKINNEDYYSILDSKLLTLLFKYCFLKTFESYIELTSDMEILDKNIAKYQKEEKSLTDEIDQDEMDIISGEQKILDNKISDILITLTNMTCNNKDTLNFTYDSVMEKILRSKEKEKNQITDYLKDLTDEEREIENLFKNSKLERWNKGLQKGLTQYVKDTYDEERSNLESIALKEKKLGVNDLVTNMNKDIYMLDLLYEENLDKEENDEKSNIENLADDDDFGDIEGEYEDF